MRVKRHHPKAISGSLTAGLHSREGQLCGSGTAALHNKSCLWRWGQGWAWGVDPRRDEQGLAGLDEVGIGEVVGCDQLINGDAETFGDSAEGIAGLHDVQCRYRRRWARGAGVGRRCRVNIEGWRGRNVENSWQGGQIARRRIGQAGSQSYTSAQYERPHYPNPQLAHHNHPLYWHLCGHNGSL